jgi:hypothetical protein
VTGVQTCALPIFGNIFFEIEKAAADKNKDNALHHIKRARQYLETVEVEFIEKD